MRNILPLRSTLLLVLLASVAVAKERAPESRYVLLSESPKEEVSPVYVSGGMSTVLRFVEPVDPAKTKLLGWEGRFEPLLAGGRLVVITPLKDLEKGDRFLLVVTLQNGKEFPFTVTTQDERFDHQINVLLDEPHLESLRVHLEHVKQRQNALEKENVIIIDCPPNLGAITLNGINISDYYVVPTVPDILSKIGISLILNRIENFKRLKRTCKIKLAGVVFTKIDNRTNLHHSTMHELSVRPDLANHVFIEKLPQRISIAEAPVDSKPFITSPSARKKSDWPDTLNLIEKLTTEFLGKVP